MATNNAINAPIPFQPPVGGTGLATLTAHGILVGEGTSPVTPIVLTNGQILVGSTGVDPVAATLTAVSGVSITVGAGSITVSATGTDTTVEVTGTSQSMAVNTRYIANNAGLVTLTLPTTASQGDTIPVRGKGAGGFKIAQNAGQSIVFGNQTTSTGTGGSVTAIQGDNFSLECITANTGWMLVSDMGSTKTLA
jgi:hypothetical protein